MTTVLYLAAAALMAIYAASWAVVIFADKIIGWIVSRPGDQFRRDLQGVKVCGFRRGWLTFYGVTVRADSCPLHKKEART